jgi:polar amino acid transport system substrate-binding protein
MNIKKTIIATFILICGMLLFLFKNSTISNSDSRTLVVGTAAGYAPFVSINQHGDYEGFDIDVAHALANEMGKELILKDLGSMASLFTALDQGSIDIIIWGLSITQDRLNKVAMVHYQGDEISSFPLIFWETIPVAVHSLADMNDKTICVEPASSQDAVLSRYPLINKLPTEKIDDALLNIQYGKADAAFVEPAIAKKFKNKYPEIKQVDIVLTPEDHVHGVGIVIKKENTALMLEVQQAINVLKSTNIIKNLEEKWSIS